jgi:hypothetical protein
MHAIPRVLESLRKRYRFLPTITRNPERNTDMNPPKTPSTSTPSASAASSGGRKPWIKKGPVEVVLEQIGKQEQKVAEMRTEFQREERELAKLQQARKVLEAT